METVRTLRELEARGLAEIEANPGRWAEPPDPTMLNRLRRASDKTQSPAEGGALRSQGL